MGELSSHPYPIQEPTPNTIDTHVSVFKNNNYEAVRSMIINFVKQKGFTHIDHRTNGSHNMIHFSNPETGQGNGITLVKPHGGKNTIPQDAVKKMVKNVQEKLIRMNNTKHIKDVVVSTLQKTHDSKSLKN